MRSEFKGPEGRQKEALTFRSFFVKLSALSLNQRFVNKLFKVIFQRLFAMGGRTTCNQQPDEKSFSNFQYEIENRVEKYEVQSI